PWTAAGGEKTLGRPLSEVRYDPDLGLVQTFEGATLVYDPSLDPPWDVQGQHLPHDVLIRVAPAAARRKVSDCTSSSSCRFFSESGHTISGRIADFWSTYGELPLSEPFQDNERDASVQVFERAVLEDHGQNDVRLRPYGRLLAEANGLLGDPAFQPAPPTGGTTKLVKAADGLRLRSGPSLDDDVIMVLPDNAEFISPAGSRGAWIPGYADGYAAWVSSHFL